MIIENKYYIMSLDKDVKGRCALNRTPSLMSSFFTNKSPQSRTRFLLAETKSSALERQTNVKNGGLL